MKRALIVATLVTAVVGFGLPCAPPFAALAACAASASRRQAATALVAAWAINQLLGFGVFGYPRTFASVALGAGLLVAALLATEVARALRARAGDAAGFAAAALVFEAALALTDLAAGESLAPFAPAIVGLVVATNAAFFGAFVFVRRFEPHSA